MTKPIEKDQRVWHDTLGKGTVVETPLRHSNLADVKWDDTNNSNLVSKQSLFPL